MAHTPVPTVSKHAVMSLHDHATFFVFTFRSQSVMPV